MRASNMTFKIMIVVPILFLAACTSPVKEEYKFGAVLPLTGNNAYYGQFAQYGIELAIEDINRAGGISGKPVSVIYEDSGGERTKAASAANKLISFDDVDAIFTITLPMIGAIGTIGEENRVPVVYFGYANSFAEGKQFVFKDTPDAADVCRMLFSQAIRDGHSKVALFALNTEAGQLCKKGINDVGSLAIFETYESGESDFKTQFTKIKNTGSTALLLVAFATDCKNAYNQINQINFKPKLYLPIHLFTCGLPDYANISRDIFEGAYGVDIDADEKNPAFIKFKESLQNRKQNINIFGSAMMYDMVWLTAEAHKDCQDHACVVENIRKTSNYKGVSGKISFDGKNVVKRGISLARFTNGSWKKVIVS